jgi:flagellar motor protein MotB
MWLLVYGAANPSITHTMLRDDANLEAVECFTTTDRAHKYTVIVLKKKIRYATMEKTMAILLVRHGIIRKELTGGESITSDDKLDKDRSLTDNVSFKWILKDLKEHGPNIEEYVADGRKSIIKALLVGKKSSSEIETMNRTGLIQAFREMEQKLYAYESETFELKQTIRSTNSNLDLIMVSNNMFSEESKVLKQKLEEAKCEILELKKQLQQA